MRRFLTSSIVICFCTAVWAEAPIRPDFGTPGGEPGAARTDPNPTLESPSIAGNSLSSDQHGGVSATDLENTLHVYRAAAAGGDAVAQFELGKMYTIGAGVTRDEAWAITYYRSAAQQGHQQAARNLADLYRVSGVAALESAPAAESEGPSASSPRKLTVPPMRGRAAMSTALVSGLRAPHSPRIRGSKDEADALKLALAHGIAVEHAGGTIAQPQVGTAPASEAHPEVTLSGGVDARYERAKRALARGNSEHAIRTLRQLAQDGHAEAALSLATLAERGEVLPKDKATAVRWWQRAAQLGSPQAQFKLGMSHLHGSGIVRDEAMAITLLRSAASTGHVGAREKLRGLYRDAGIPFPRFPTAAQQSRTSARQLNPRPANNWSFDASVSLARPVSYVADVSVEFFREFATLRQIRVGRPGELIHGPNYVPLTPESLLKGMPPRPKQDDGAPRKTVPQAGASETTSMKGILQSSYMLTAVTSLDGGIPAGEITENLRWS